MSDRGTADPVSVTESLDQKTVEYLPNEEAVRYVAQWRRQKPETGTPDAPPENEPIYRTLPIDDWAQIEAASTGATHIRTLIGDRLDGETDGITVGAASDGGEPRIAVHYTTWRGETGEETVPAASYEEILEATPITVTVTVTFQGQRHTQTIPVTVERTTGKRG